MTAVIRDRVQLPQQKYLENPQKAEIDLNKSSFLEPKMQNAVLLEMGRNV
jgi:hypothetical protein